MPMGAVEALAEIYSIMNGTEWSPDTLEEIAGVLERAGFELEDIDA